MIPADLLAWAGIAKRLRKYTEIVRAVTLPTFFETRLQDDTVAYPYRIFEAAVRIERPLVGDRTERFVASVDRSRRLAVRADAFPETETRTVEDVLVLPSELSDEGTRARARDAVFKWTLRRYSLTDPPEIRFERDVAGYKLFWLAARDDGDVVVDSVRGTEEPLRD